MSYSRILRSMPLLTVALVTGCGSVGTAGPTKAAETVVPVDGGSKAKVPKPPAELRVGNTIYLTEGAVLYPRHDSKEADGQRFHGDHTQAMTIIALTATRMRLEPDDDAPCYPNTFRSSAIHVWADRTAAAHRLAEDITEQLHPDGSGVVLVRGLIMRPNGKVRLTKELDWPLSKSPKTLRSNRIHHMARGPVADPLEVEMPLAGLRVGGRPAPKLHSRWAKTKRDGVFTQTHQCWQLFATAELRGENPQSPTGLGMELSAHNALPEPKPQTGERSRPVVIAGRGAKTNGLGFAGPNEAQPVSAKLIKLKGSSAYFDKGESLYWPNNQGVGTLSKRLVVKSYSNGKHGIQCFVDGGIRLCTWPSYRGRPQTKVSSAAVAKAMRCPSGLFYSFGKCLSPAQLKAHKRTFKARNRHHERLWLETKLAVAKPAEAANIALAISSLLVEEFDALSVYSTGKFNVARLKNDMIAKAEAMTRAQTSLFGVLNYYRNNDVTTCASLEIAGLYDRFGRALVNATIPPGLSDAQRLEYQSQLVEVAVPIWSRALVAYEAILGRKKSVGTCHTGALEGAMAIRADLTR